MYSMFVIVHWHYIILFLGKSYIFRVSSLYSLKRKREVWELKDRTWRSVFNGYIYWQRRQVELIPPADILPVGKIDEIDQWMKAAQVERGARGCALCKACIGSWHWLLVEYLIMSIKECLMFWSLNEWSMEAYAMTMGHFDRSVFLMWK